MFPDFNICTTLFNLIVSFVAYRMIKRALECAPVRQTIHVYSQQPVECRQPKRVPACSATRCILEDYDAS